eukprot:scaffold309234_cov13-Prasinocladus_malaysianus.AAC.1
MQTGMDDGIVFTNWIGYSIDYFKRMELKLPQKIPSDQAIDMKKATESKTLKTKTMRASLLLFTDADLDLKLFLFHEKMKAVEKHLAA